MLFTNPFRTAVETLQRIAMGGSVVDPALVRWCRPAAAMTHSPR
jgi:hypothetical protein